MYYLSVGAIFKNESHILKEWIEHHLFHGVEHFYLINDGSTDNYMKILQPYLDKGIITLFQSFEPHYLGRQATLYTRLFLPHLRETQWLAIIDIDEFLWSTRDVDLRLVLRQWESIGLIMIRTSTFGSNCFVQEPPNVVEYYTMRCEYKTDTTTKYIVNSNCEFRALNVHNAFFKSWNVNNKEKVMDYTTDRDHPWFMVNHYWTLSYTTWRDIRCVRGDGDSYLTRTEEMFQERDLGFNEVEDLRLWNQNRYCLFYRTKRNASK